RAGGLALDVLGRLAGLADEPLGFGACAVEQLLRLALGVGLALLGLLLDRGEPLLGRRELLVVLSERAGELGGRLLAPLGERGLELGRGGRGLGALPLEDGLRLLATRGGLAVGDVEDLVGAALRVREPLRDLGVGARDRLVGVRTRLRDLTLGLLLRVAQQGVGVGLGAAAQLLGLLLREAEDP